MTLAETAEADFSPTKHILRFARMDIVESSICDLGTPLLLKHVSDGEERAATFARWQHGDATAKATGSDAVQVILALSGGHRVHQKVGNRLTSREITAGTVGLISPEEPTVTEIEGEVDVFQVFLRWSFIKEIGELSVQPNRSQVEIADLRIREWVIGMFVASQRGDPDDDLLLTSQTYSLANRVAALGDVRRSRSKGGGLSPAARRRVDELIDSRLGQNTAGVVSLAELASAAGLSVHHFIKMFRQDTGTTPYAHVLGCRIRRAVELLAQKDRTVAEVAEQTGFASPSHFGLLFREHTGVTPGAFCAAVSA